MCADLKPIPSCGQFRIDETTVTTLSLNHPGGAVGYRFDRAGKRLVVISDHEQTEVPDSRLAEFAHAADLIYLDAQYLDVEYMGQQALSQLPARSRQGWGHSSIEASITTAVAAQARELHLGHHDPHRSDAELAEIERYAKVFADQLQKDLRRNRRCKVQMAREALAWKI